jgi:hypothetical protein
VPNHFSSSEEGSETSENESEGEDDVRPQTSDWQLYSESDGDLARFPYKFFMDFLTLADGTDRFL